MTDLVKRLVTHADDCERLSMPEGRPALAREAANELERLRDIEVLYELIKRTAAYEANRRDKLKEGQANE